MNEQYKIIVGNKKTSERIKEVSDLLNLSMQLGERMTHHSLENIRQSFEENRCVYAINEENKIKGFMYFYIKQEPNRKPCLYPSGLVVHPDVRKQGLGRDLMNAMLNMMENFDQKLDVAFISAHPTTLRWFKELGLTYLNNDKAFTEYGIHFDLQHPLGKKCEVWMSYQNSPIKTRLAR